MLEILIGDMSTVKESAVVNGAIIKDREKIVVHFLVNGLIHHSAHIYPFSDVYLIEEMRKLARKACAMLLQHRKVKKCGIRNGVRLNVVAEKEPCGSLSKHLIDKFRRWLRTFKKRNNINIAFV